MTKRFIVAYKLLSWFWLALLNLFPMGYETCNHYDAACA